MRKVCINIKLVCDHCFPAGIMGTSYHLTPEGFELQQTVNYLSSVILVDQLKLMLKETQGRIILVSSAVHRLSFCNLDDFMFRFVCSNVNYPLAFHFESYKIICCLLFTSFDYF